MTSTRPALARSLLHVLATLSCLSYALSLPSSFPHVYPGQPSGDFSPKWQDYFLVKDPLPNVTFPVARSFAGNLPVQRPNHPNNTLFFYGFEKSEGSLTAAPDSHNDEPWGIWLNGGPGSSSMFGLFFENGPIRINQDYSASPNNHSWDKLVDYIWIDQPVGVGFATADADGYVSNEDDMGRDFMGFLANLVKVFPSLRKRPLYLTGESYAGMYIPYIMKTYFNMQDPPVNIAKILIGDGSIASAEVFELLPSLSVIETFPQLIGYNQDVYNYFKAQTHLCGYDLNLTYPQTTPLPPVPLIPATARDVPFALNKMSNYEFMQELYRRAEERGLNTEEPEQGLVKRDASEFLKDRKFDEIDPWYGCVLIQMYFDYALNYTFPWSLSKNSSTFGINVYDVQDATNPRWSGDASVFLNDDRVRTALHAPIKEWEMTFDFVFGEAQSTDPSVEATAFLSDLATNMTAQDIGVVLYSGNNDALIAHRSTEIAIQNTTFGGIRGFTRKPSTPWHSDDGTFAGVIHQERNWTYALFTDASHLVPQSVPAAAFTFFREFVLGNNRTGLVIDTSGQVTVEGGEDQALAGDVIPGADEIYYGSMATQSTYVYPEATRSAWRDFIRTETARPLSTSSLRDSQDNSGHKTDTKSWKHVVLGALVGVVLTFL